MDADALEDISARWLASLAHDFKDFLHVVADDLDLDDGLRERVITAVLYTLAPGDVVPDTMGAIGYLDDALGLRVALDAVREEAPARFESYRDRIPEMVASVEGDDLSAWREALGDVYEPFRQRVFSPDRNVVKGKRARDLMADPDGAGWLDDEVSEAALKMDFKDAAVAAAARKAVTVIPVFQQKLRR
ncbi:MAG: DUF1232 domain-containing protein [Polyangiales bacterium]